jgi:hypothetical protein
VKSLHDQKADSMIGHFPFSPTKAFTAANAVFLEDHIPSGSGRSSERSRSRFPGTFEDHTTKKIATRYATTTDHQGLNISHVLSEQQHTSVKLPGTLEQDRRVTIPDFHP